MNENDNHSVTLGTYDWEDHTPPVLMMCFSGFLILDDADEVYYGVDTDSAVVLQKLAETLNNLRLSKKKILSIEVGKVMAKDPKDAEIAIKAGCFITEDCSYGYCESYWWSAMMSKRGES